GRPTAAPYRVGARADADVSSVSWPDPDHKRRLRRGVCGPQRQFDLANRRHLRLSPHRHVFARWRGQDRARAEAAARDRAAASARLGEAGLCGTRWQRLSRHRQAEYSRPAKEAAATNRADRRHCKKTVRIRRFDLTIEGPEPLFLISI